MRNTPNEGMVTSPVQRLMGRRTQSVLPAMPAVLKPSKIPISEHSKLQWKQHQAAQHLCTRSQLPPLKPGDHVRMQPIDGRKEWRPATVTKALPFNNYEVWDGNRSFTRARIFLRKKPSPEPAVPTNNHQLLGTTPAVPVPLRTRPARANQHTEGYDGIDDEPAPSTVPA
ncbi:integrase core domain, partial [Elysia marginata]